MAEKKVHKGKHVWTSQFSMGQLDFERFDNILKHADTHGMRVWNGERAAIKPFFACLFQFYKQIRHMVIDKDKVESMRRAIRSDIRMLYSPDTAEHEKEFMWKRLENNIDEFSDIIYELKQKLGLGIEINRQMSMKKKMERALGVSSD